MSTKTKLFSASLILAASLMTTGMAQAQLATNDPNVGGQANQCWGDIASQLAKLGMGDHTRSTTAANNVGGFAASGEDGNIFGITFNELNADGNHGRTGVGMVSRGQNSPHTVHPGDGGNGFHAANNGEVLANLIDPVTGQAPTGPSTLSCEAADPTL
jgi:hypothetical protein